MQLLLDDTSSNNLGFKPANTSTLLLLNTSWDSWIDETLIILAFVKLSVNHRS